MTRPVCDGYQVDFVSKIQRMRTVWDGMTVYQG